MKTIYIMLLALIVSASAIAQKKPKAIKNDTLTVVLKVPANLAYNFLLVNSTNVDTLSTLTAKEVNTVVKPGAQAVSQYVLQSFNAAFNEWVNKSKPPIKK